MQRFIDIAAFFESLSLNISMLYPFTPCQIYNIKFRFSYLHSLILFNLRLDINGKYGMGPGALIVHSCWWNSPGFFSLKQHIDSLFIAVYFSLYLHIWASNSAFLGLKIFDLAEYILNYSWKNSAALGQIIISQVRNAAHYWICFTGSCLSVGENTTVISLG